MCRHGDGRARPPGHVKLAASEHAAAVPGSSPDIDEPPTFQASSGRRCPPRAAIRDISEDVVDKKIVQQRGLARRMHTRFVRRDTIPVATTQAFLKWGLRSLRSYGCRAPDPYGHDRALLSGQRPHFLLFPRPFVRFWTASSTADRPESHDFAPRRPATLDDRGGRALVCGVLGSQNSAGCGHSGPARPGQRSFNWQSTAFVMRGLWVRFPPLALTPTAAD